MKGMAGGSKSSKSSGGLGKKTTGFSAKVGKGGGKGFGKMASPACK